MSKTKSDGTLIPAVAYLRKSTKGEKLDASGKKRERQEKSIPQQREEIEKLVKGKFHIMQWFDKDEGVSGWKRGAKRPDFQRMLQEVKELGAEAIICDNLDRFSRASVGEVNIDAEELRKAGCRYIVTASHGTYDLGRKHDIGEILKFVVAVWSANEYSRQLSRRISIRRRNDALEGKRSGSVPYGLAADGKGGLVPGDASKVKTLKWIFKAYAEGLSLSRICVDLNARKVPSPKGLEWRVTVIANLLRRKCFIGMLEYGRNRGGNFFTLDGTGEVVEKDSLIERYEIRERVNPETKQKETYEVPVYKAGKVILEKSAHIKALIDQPTFEKVQRRLTRMKLNRRAEKASYTLSGVLFCGKCGLPLYGYKHKDSTRYRCSASRGTCPAWQVHEDWILPFILKTLGEEIASLQHLLTDAPADINMDQARRRGKLQAERDRLAKEIERGKKNLLLVDDAGLVSDLNAMLLQKRNDLAKLDADLIAAQEPESSKEQAEALAAWWDDFQKNALEMPVTPEKLLGHSVDPAECDLTGLAVSVDPMKVNAALKDLGARVSLLWKARFDEATGRTFYDLAPKAGTFKLGARGGPLSPLNLAYSPAGH